MKPSKAELEADKARKAARNARDRFDSKRRRMIEKASLAIDEQLSSDRERVNALQVKARELEAICEDEYVAKQHKSTPWPIGTKLYEWDYKRYGRNLSKTKEFTGKVGVFEVLTKDSRASVGSQGSPGSHVVRILKKDGSPGLKVCVLGDYRYGEWLPDGVKPKNVSDS